MTVMRRTLNSEDLAFIDDNDDDDERPAFYCTINVEMDLAETEQYC